MLRSYLRPDSRFLIVEYNIDRGNFAVPYPISYRRGVELSRQADFSHTKLLATRPSRFLREIYAAASYNQDENGAIRQTASSLPLN
jgi:hypothetical protein